MSARPATRKSTLATKHPAAPKDEISTEALVEAKPQTPKTPAKAKNAPAPKPASKAVASTETALLGIYLTAEVFNDAKAAYLADWSNGGEANNFARWIGAALVAHAARTPAQRAHNSPLPERAEVRTGSSRSFNVPTDDLARMREGVNADQKAGRWLSDSGWCSEGIARAIEAAREKNGGTLPTPPPRLPNRLVR